MNKAAAQVKGKSGGQVQDVKGLDRDALIREYAPQIKYIAYRLAMRLPPHVDVGDLINAGVIGLMDALEKYDPSRQIKFRTYAEFRIRGAMLDELRSLDWVPRSVRRKASTLEKASADLEHRLGRPPTEEELAEALGLDLEGLAQLLREASGVPLLHIEEVGMDEEGAERNLLACLADPHAQDPFEDVQIRELKETLGKAIELLPRKERLVVTLYYYEELTMKEIAKVLEITESRVSQLHAQAILRLRGKLQRMGIAKAGG